MIRTELRSFRALATVMVAAMLNLSFPSVAIVLSQPPEPSKAKEASKPKPVRSRLLTSKEMRSQKGTAGESPYLAGQNKWDIIYQGINLLTGNYSTSGTDLSFEGGYGVPVNVTRAYSSNNGDEGPLGYGWTLSVDVRSTAGGILKSSASPVMSVPTNMKERPTGDDDPRLPSDPVSAVVATDAGGVEETIQKDVDGVLTTPPWDHNVVDSTYEHVNQGGSIYEVLASNKVTTLDGTEYTYTKHGTYVGGMVARNGGVNGEPSNVLKIDDVKDRQGNTTHYQYSTPQVTFVKTNGTVTEDKLAWIKMPNGHQITFIWGSGTTTPANRIIQARDNGNYRIVQYTYTSGNLTKVTSPGNKSTLFDYGAATTNSGWTDPVSSNLLTKITDPRGFSTEINYIMGYVYVLGVVTDKAPVVLTLRRGVKTGAVPILFRRVFDPGYYYPRATFIECADDAAQTNMNFISIDQKNGSVDGVPYFETDLTQNILLPGTGLTSPSQWADVVKRYDLSSQNLIHQETYARGNYGHDNNGTGVPHLEGERKLDLPFSYQRTVTDTEYNFTGKPLTVSSVDESYSTYNNLSWSSPVKQTAYAYWGADKYFQEKAVVDPAGRISYTDYFDSTAGVGSKGQTKAVYDPKRGDFPSYSSPAGLPTGWYDTIAPGSSGVPSALFYNPSTSASGYDLKGRPTDVWKIAPNGISYVHTTTTYGADNDGSWGQASDVYEDAGGTGSSANRHTRTNHYTSWGKADVVTDADNRTFSTVYDLDGVVQSVTRTDVTPSVPLVTYTYGTSGSSNGMVTNIVDGLSGVAQAFTYQGAGTAAAPLNGVGQVKQVTQSGGTADGYTVAYSYSITGDKSQVTYTTPDGTSSWRYTDYMRVGDPTNPSRVPQTLVKLSGGNPTAEEIHYAYDSSGRLIHSAFAQTKRTGFTPATGSSYYDASHLAQSRARASYVYDPVGRLLSVSHWWDTLNSDGSTYTSAPIFKNECAYDSVKGLKTDNAFYVPVSGSWSLHHNEQYGYDQKLDYLTNADYNDGLANEVQSWSYDAAGNRSNSGYVYDNLNAMSASPWATYVNDPLGYRTSETSGSDTTAYTWDVSQRMVARTGTTAATTSIYEYRADGMRTRKTVGTSVSGYTNTLSRHDGTMPFELETLKPDGTVLSTREAIGARGIDAEETVTGTWSGATRTLGSPTIAYPIYDGHGNRVCTLVRFGSGSWATDSPRFVDAWGATRFGSLTGGSPMRYCATLGHLQDEESDLIYMRARYYESRTGRFITEDPARSGLNFFAYAANDPVQLRDQSGYDVVSDCILGIMAGFFTAMLASSLGGASQPTMRDIVYGGAATVGWVYGAAYLKQYVANILSPKGGKLTELGEKVVGTFGGVAGAAAFVLGMRAGECLFELFMMDISDEGGGAYLW